MPRFPAARLSGPLVALSSLAVWIGLNAQTSTGPATSESFRDAIKEFKRIRDYTFGTSGRAIGNPRELAARFAPYGIAGTTVINREWQRYQPFNPENFVFQDRSLDLMATIPPDGGLVEGGIHSGQIWSKETFQPGVAGATVYAFEIRMRIPGGRGMWPAFWLFSKASDKRNDGSEIDHPEFFVMQYQNQFDWTGYNHGPGMGSDFFSIKTKYGIWHPGVDFSADYHDYQTLWTPNAVYKYVDGRLVVATNFKWTAPAPAQMGANLAVGSSDPKLHGLQPDSIAEFPSALSIAHIRVWSM